MAYHTSTRPEKVIILSSDVEGYTNLTSGLSSDQHGDFTAKYYKTLEKIFSKKDSRAQEFKPYAGDAAIAIFRNIEEPGLENRSTRAVNAAIEISLAAKRGKIPRTRIGLFCGSIMKISVGPHVLDLGHSFSASNRLEQLCGFFNVKLLMGRIVKNELPNPKYIVSIGKITPKGFSHPIHVFSLYDPRIYNWPQKSDDRELLKFIAMKNDAMEHFSGNKQKNIKPDYSIAEAKLHQAAEHFRRITGRDDVATQRVLDYIGENPFPPKYFLTEGMRIVSKQGDRNHKPMSPLSRSLLEAAHSNFYQAFIAETYWEKLFKLEWVKAGETIIKLGDHFDGVYNIIKGSVQIINADGQLVASLNEGDIFGEMAFFSASGKRNATARAKTDLALRKISHTDFDRLPPIIQDAFQRIGLKRLADLKSLARVRPSNAHHWNSRLP